MLGLLALLSPLGLHTTRTPGQWYVSGSIVFSVPLGFLVLRAQLYRLFFIVDYALLCHRGGAGARLLERRRACAGDRDGSSPGRVRMLTSTSTRGGKIKRHHDRQDEQQSETPAAPTERIAGSGVDPAGIRNGNDDTPIAMRASGQGHLAGRATASACTKDKSSRLLVCPL